MKCTSASSWGCELKYHEVRQKKRSPGQPLREAVSWNVNHINCFIRKKSQPLREAVSWNDICFMRRTVPSSQPLREAVSWNEPDTKVGPLSLVSLFVRLWVEIARFIPVSGYTCSQPLREAVSWNTVNYVGERVKGKSASSWGCELKYKNIVLPMLTWIVSLFVRLWVEITVEKFSMSDIRCQPLREAVSWNKKHDNYYVAGPVVSLFVRL